MIVRRRFRLISVTFLLLAALTTAGCDKLEGLLGSSEPYPLELDAQMTRVLGKSLADLPDEGLVDQTGQHFEWEMLRGEPALISAIYTTCPMPDMCPLLTSQVAKVQERLADDERNYRYVLYSLDPLTDKPAVMRKYAEEQGLDLSRTLMITAEKPEQIEALNESLEIAAKGADDGSITHNMRTYLVDSQGRIAYAFRQAKWKVDHVVERMEELE